MNILNKHRILEKGDEYLANGASGKGEWQKVPSADWGIQIMFTKYTQVRRPGEKPISSDSPTSDEPAKAAKTENDQTSAPSRSGAEGGRSDPTGDLISAVLQAASLTPNIDKIPVTVGTPEFKGEIEKAVTKAIETKHDKINDITQIKFANPKGDYIWTGRNGTFGTQGLDLMRWTDSDGNDKVSITPLGKRGIGNCVIQFPASIIPQVVEWLNRTKKNTKK